MITEIANDKIKISAVNVANDKPLEIVHPLPNWNYFSLFVGTPGSGKTTLCINLLKKYYKKKYDRIYFFTGSKSTLPDDFLSKLNPSRVLTDLDTLENIIEELKSLKENEKVLMVFDDMVKSIIDNEKVIMNLVYNRRHISGGVSIMMISQKLNKIPLSIRSAVDSIYFFSLTNKREVATLLSDYIQSLNKNEYDQIITYIIKKADKHAFFFADLRNNSFYYKFNQLTITD